MADVYRAHACTDREALERLAAEADLGPDRLSRIRVDFDASIHRLITCGPDLVDSRSRPSRPLASMTRSRACSSMARRPPIRGMLRRRPQSGCSFPLGCRRRPS